MIPTPFLLTIVSCGQNGGSEVLSQVTKLAKLVLFVRPLWFGFGLGFGPWVILDQTELPFLGLCPSLLVNGESLFMSAPPLHVKSQHNLYLLQCIDKPLSPAFQRSVVWKLSLFCCFYMPSHKPEGLAADKLHGTSGMKIIMNDLNYMSHEKNIVLLMRNCSRYIEFSLFSKVTALLIFLQGVNKTGRGPDGLTAFEAADNRAIKALLH